MPDIFEQSFAPGASSNAVLVPTIPPVEPDLIGYPRIVSIFSKDNDPASQNNGAQDKERHCGLVILGANWLYNHGQSNPSFDGSQSIAQYFRTVMGYKPKTALYVHNLAVAGTVYGDPNGANNANHYAAPEMFLKGGGSTLSAGITSGATSISVTDVTNLYTGSNFVNTYLQLGGRDVGQAKGEIVQITSSPGTTSGTQTLTVTRAVHDSTDYPAAAWGSGTIVRPVMYQNGTPSWFVMDLRPVSVTGVPGATAVSDSNNYGLSLTAAQWIAQLILDNLKNDTIMSVYPPDFIFVDNTANRLGWMLTPAASRVDTSNNNTLGGMSDLQWQQAEADLYQTIFAVTGIPVISNTGGWPMGGFTTDPVNQQLAGSGNYLVGGMTEAIKQDGTCGSEQTSSSAQTRRLLSAWASVPKLPHALVVGASDYTVTRSGEASAYKTMRFTLALTCCSGDGYYQLDAYGSTDHGGDHSTLPWFEEYDLTPANTGQRGWLGQPLGAATEPQRNCLIRYFQNGVALWNGSSASYTFTLNNTYQRIVGTQDATTNNGASCPGSVTVPAMDGLFLTLPGLMGTPTPATRRFSITLPSFGPLHYWPLQENSGATSAADAAGRGNTATVHGTITFGSSGPSLAEGCTSALLNGSTGYLSTALQMSDPTAFTIVTLFKATGQGPLLGFGNAQTGTGDSSYNFNLYIDSASKLSFQCYNGSAFNTVQSAATYADSAWHLAIASIGSHGGNVRLVVDNATAVTTAITNNGFPQTFSGWWKLGAINTAGATNPPSSNFGHASLAHVALFPYVLAPWQETALYNALSAA